MCKIDICQSQTLTGGSFFQISRMLAAKASLAARVDALGEDVGTDMAVENKAKLESRLKMFEDDQVIKAMNRMVHVDLCNI